MSAPRALVIAASAVVGLAVGCLPIDDDSTSETPIRYAITLTVSGPQDAVAVGESVTLTAQATEGAKATPTYAWLQTAGPGVSLLSAQSATCSFTAPSLAARQDLTFMATASDGLGGVGTGTVLVTVEADPNYGQGEDDDTNPPPVAHAGDDLDTTQGAPVRLDGTDSTGLSLSYRWTQISGTAVTLLNPKRPVASFTAPDRATSAAANRYEFLLTVTDGDQRVSTDRIAVTVIAKPKVRVETTMGDFTIELELGWAPETVANFLQYVDDGFYEGTIFHRVEHATNYAVIQAGGFDTDLEEKETRDPVPLEAGLPNDRGTVGLARGSAADSGTSQFYINLEDNDGFNADENPPGYAVFGTVISGLDIVDDIGDVETETRDDFNNIPVEDVVIERVVRLN